MPNWCMNTVTITGDNDKLKALHDAANEGNLLEHMVPIGKWDYSTALDEWGTKWDVNECSADLQDGILHLNFDTAWGPPTTAYDNYIQANEGMNIEASYYEPGMCFIGHYNSEDGTDESYEVDFGDPNWADTIPSDLIDDWGLDYEYDSWKEMNEEEDDDDA